MSGARAIEAYVARRLSPRGRARVEAWLARSPDAQRLCASVRVYAAAREAAADLAMPSSSEALSARAEMALFAKIAAARALDAALDQARELAPDRIAVKGLEARTLASVGAARTLGEVLAFVRDDAPKVDASRLEAGLFAKLTAGPAAGEVSRDAAPQRGELGAGADETPVARTTSPATRVEPVALERARNRALATLQREVDAVATEASERARLECVELPLRRELARLRSRRRASTAGVLLVAAAALMFGWRGASVSPTPSREERVAPIVHAERVAPNESAVDLGAPRLTAEVTCLSGEARAEGRDAPVGLGDALAEDHLLKVDGALHARLAEGTGIVVSPGPSATARVRLARLRVDAIELSLLEGRLTSEVSTGTPYVVEAGPYRVEVRGTRFVVDHEGDEVAVRLDEGRVAVVRDGATLAVLEAPAEWRSSSSLAIPEGSERPRALTVAALDWPTFHIPGGRFAALEVDGTLAPSADGLSLRMPAGPHELVAIDLEGRRHRGVVDVNEGFVLDERALTPERAAPRRGFLAPEVIRAVVAPRTRALQGCYERTLRRTNPELAGSYTLRVIVGADGRVRRARVVTEAETPPPFVACLRLEAQSWSFPRPEGDAPVTFDLPLAFHARGL